MKKGTIIGCLAFTGPKGEDRKKIEKNWPFEEPKLNNVESHEGYFEQYNEEQRNMDVSTPIVTKRIEKDVVELNNPMNKGDCFRNVRNGKIYIIDSINRKQYYILTTGTYPCVKVGDELIHLGNAVPT